MEAALKKHILKKIEQLPEDRMLEVLDFIEFMLAKTSGERMALVEATDKDILLAIEASGSLEHYYDDSQDIYTLDDGEPL